MNIVVRAYLQTKKELPEYTPIKEFDLAMRKTMVRWIHMRVYDKKEWPGPFGPYPKELEHENKVN